VHHIDQLAAKRVLNKYFVREVDTPRSSPLTFEADGFYAVLREKVLLAVGRRHVTGTTPRMIALQMALFLLHIAFALSAILLPSLSCLFVSAVLLAHLAVATHNFFHQVCATSLAFFFLCSFFMRCSLRRRIIGECISSI
jgi:hypothetical protein